MGKEWLPPPGQCPACGCELLHPEPVCQDCGASTGDYGDMTDTGNPVTGEPAAEEISEENRLDLVAMFAVLKDCCLHNPQWLPEDADEEIAWIGDHHTGSDSSSLIIVRLKPGDYGLLTQQEDYTGHGCQCSSVTAREPTLSRLLSHLSEDELLELISDDNEEKELQSCLRFPSLPRSSVPI